MQLKTLVVRITHWKCLNAEGLRHFFCVFQDRHAAFLVMQIVYGSLLCREPRVSAEQTMPTERKVKHDLLLDCTFALVLQDDELLGMRLEHRDVAVTKTAVTHFLLTKELAVKMHEQLLDILKITRH